MSSNEKRERNEKIYLELITPDEDGVCPSYSEIALKYNVSRQRIAQIFNNMSEKNKTLEQTYIVKHGRKTMTKEQFLSTYEKIINELNNGVPTNTIAEKHHLSTNQINYIKHKATKHELIHKTNKHKPTEHKKTKKGLIL